MKNFHSCNVCVPDTTAAILDVGYLKSYSKPRVRNTKASGDTEDNPSNVIKCGGYNGQNNEMKRQVCNNLELSFKNLCSKR